MSKQEVMFTPYRPLFLARLTFKSEYQELRKKVGEMTESEWLDYCTKMENGSSEDLIKAEAVTPLKGFKYLIDYEYGTAELYTPDTNWKSRFEELAETCFGIRKSIGDITLLSKSEEEYPYYLAIPNEYERLEHSEDEIVWDIDGNKILES